MTTSLHVDCNYITRNWWILNDIYQCIVQNPVSITSQDESEITSVSGTHSSNNGNDDVFLINFNGKTMNYFPKGLEKIYKNLKGIWIQRSHLKMISQSDISAFPELLLLDFYDNDVETIEERIFDFNPKLKYIAMNKNKISQIHPTIFDNLRFLSTLYLESNICISINAYNTADVQKAIQQVKAKCSSAKETTESDVNVLKHSSCCAEITKLDENLKSSHVEYQVKLCDFRKL